MYLEDYGLHVEILGHADFDFSTDFKIMGFPYANLDRVAIDKACCRFDCYYEIILMENGEVVFSESDLLLSQIEEALDLMERELTIYKKNFPKCT